MVYGIKPLFNQFPVTINLLIFTVLASLIWLAGTRLSYLIDSIAEKTQLARALLGLILLATATELPEFVTTLTASSSGNGTLALNNMFGGMLLQLAVLTVADVWVKKGTLCSRPHDPTVAVAGILCIISLSTVLVAKSLGDIQLGFQLGLGSLSIALLYVLSMFVLKIMQNKDTWSPVDLPDDDQTDPVRDNKFDQKSLKYLICFSILCAAVILACGVSLVDLAETLSKQTGLGSSFIGASLLALTTSLPELSTSIAAVKVKAYTMAISNVFGSNLIMTFLLFPNDFAFTKGPIINEIDTAATFALCAGIFMTAIYCLGLLVRSKRKILGMGIESGILGLCYIASLAVLFSLR